MTKTLEEMERFIELRAKGYSYGKIAEELDISKPTLIKWQGQCNDRIKKQHYFELENILEKYSVMQLVKLEGYAKMLQAVNQAIGKKIDSNELETMSVQELFRLALQVEKRMLQDTGKPLLKVEIPDDFFTLATERFIEL